MANAAARWSFCGSSTFFALVVLISCFSSVVAALGHSLVLQKRDAPYHQLAVRGVKSAPDSGITTTTESTTITDAQVIATTTQTTLTVSASATPVSSTPSSSPKSSASPSFSLGSAASSASIQTTSGARSASSTASFSPSAPSTASQRASGSAEGFSLSSAVPASKNTSASQSISVLPSQPSASGSVNTLNLIPVTTLAVPSQEFVPIYTPVAPSPLVETTPSTSVPATPTPVVAAAAGSSGFWNRKGAVAAVFVVVSLVAAGSLLVAFIVLRKKHRARKLREDHGDLWEKFSDHSHRTRSNSPGPSINAAPLDAFAARDESYLPASREVDFDHHVDPSSYSSTPVQHPDYYPPTWSQQTSTIASRAAPPATPREPVGRASYQQSIDSFYGATGRAL